MDSSSTDAALGIGVAPKRATHDPGLAAVVPVDGPRRRHARVAARSWMRSGIPGSVALVAALASVAVGAAGAGAANTVRFSGALSGTVTSRSMKSCTAGTGGMNWPLGTTLSPSKAKNWSVSVVFPANGTYKSFVSGGKASFVLQSGLDGWVATSGSFTIHGKNGGERGGAVQLDETATVNLTLGAHEGGASGTVYVKGGWKCG